MVKLTPEPSLSRQRLLILPLPKVVTPTTGARSLSIMAPASTSLALALNSLTRTTSGMSRALPPPFTSQSVRFPSASTWYSTRPPSRELASHVDHRGQKPAGVVPQV